MVTEPTAPPRRLTPTASRPWPAVGRV